MSLEEPLSEDTNSEGNHSDDSNNLEQPQSNGQITDTLP